MSAYYNEIDPYAAQWLRNLIAAGHIADGEVDERSIIDVPAADLRDFTQCHFFAGIGGWSVALRLAGWPDDRPVWTGSCPCQPFSAAGAGKAADDSRHLWPAWFSLISVARPAIVFGEQVEAAIGWGWLDAVFADMEGAGYACGASVLPACGIGAPHIRQRTWFVADANGGDAGAAGLQRSGEHGQRAQDGRAGEFLADSARGRQREFGNASRPRSGGHSDGGIEPSGLDNPASARHAQARRGESPQSEGRRGMFGVGSDPRELGDTNGGRRGQCDEGERPISIANATGDDAWSNLEWLACTDGRSRPVEPGTFPLAHGIQRRTSKLRAYGNAIVPQVAAEFIKAFA